MLVLFSTVFSNHLDSTWTMEFWYSFNQSIVLGKVSDFGGLWPHCLMDKIMFIEKKDWRESSVSKARGNPVT